MSDSWTLIDSNDAIMGQNYKHFLPQKRCTSQSYQHQNLEINFNFGTKLFFWRKLQIYQIYLVAPSITKNYVLNNRWQSAYKDPML